MLLKIPFKPNRPRYTTPSGLTQPQLNLPNGLSFSVSTDQTAYAPGQEVEVVTDEKNTLAKTNNVPVANNWPVTGLAQMYFGPCVSPDIPYGIAVYQGDYTSANYSSATPLNLYNPKAIFLCEPQQTSISTSFSFEPSSDIADIISTNSIPKGKTSSTISQHQISAEMTLKGYWTDGSSPKFTYFAPGFIPSWAGTNGGI